MTTVMNVSKNTKSINLPGGRSVYLPRRAKLVLTSEEFACTDVRVLVRGGYLRVLGGER